MENLKIIMVVIVIFMIGCKQNPVVENEQGQQSVSVEKSAEDHEVYKVTPSIIYLDYPKAVNYNQEFYVCWKANPADTHRLFFDGNQYNLHGKTCLKLTSTQSYVLRLENNNGKFKEIDFTIYVSNKPYIQQLRFTNNGGVKRALYITVYQSDSVTLENMTTGQIEVIHWDIMRWLDAYSPILYRITATNSYGTVTKMLTVY